MYLPDLGSHDAAPRLREVSEPAVSRGADRLVFQSGGGWPEAPRRGGGWCGRAAWTILRPAWFSQNFSEDLFLEPLRLGEVRLPAGDGREPFLVRRRYPAHPLFRRLDPQLSGGTLHASTDGGATFTARATNLPAGRLTAVPGTAGDLWIADGAKGLLHSTDGGRTFTTLGAVQSASALGFGKAAPGASYQALYLIGTVKDVTGVLRSTDQGATWLRVNDDAHKWGSIGGTGVVTGDPDTYGRVNVGTSGRGLEYGDPS
ncbi:hypothetical protein GCM10010307_26210 [Streptomyces vastus]|uniref:Exo-alpha-sialidase n=1 Tax=Streptomyces vastus TaxID=285451 RepID=A0ABN3QQK7_9ACTN